MDQINAGAASILGFENFALPAESLRHIAPPRGNVYHLMNHVLSVLLCGEFTVSQQNSAGRFAETYAEQRHNIVA